VLSHRLIFVQGIFSQAMSQRQVVHREQFTVLLLVCVVMLLSVSVATADHRLKSCACNESRNLFCDSAMALDVMVFTETTTVFRLFVPGLRIMLQRDANNCGKIVDMRYE